MNKQAFLDRAKNLSNLAKDPEDRAQKIQAMNAARADHLKEISQFDPEAARLEQAFFDANDASAEAELAVARYYARKLEANVK
jgi:hypothetical protein